MRKVMLIAGLVLAGCSDGVVAQGGRDAGEMEADAVVVAGPEVQQQTVDSGVCETTPVPAQRFGGSACLLQVPAGVDCATAILYVGSARADEAVYVRHCEVVQQVSVSGEECSRLERGEPARLSSLCR